MRYYDLKPGEWRRQKRTGAGFDWIENAYGRRSVARGFSNVYASFTYDANTAKTRRDSAWKLPLDRDGTATMFDNRSNEDELMQFCRHQTAEDYVVVRKSGIEYRRWSMKKHKVSDNEFLDTDAACRVLAEYVGCSEPVVGENQRSDAGPRFALPRARKYPRPLDASEETSASDPTGGENTDANGSSQPFPATSRPRLRGRGVRRF